MTKDLQPEHVQEILHDHGLHRCHDFCLCFVFCSICWRSNCQIASHHWKKRCPNASHHWRKRSPKNNRWWKPVWKLAKDRWARPVISDESKLKWVKSKETMKIVDIARTMWIMWTWQVNGATTWSLFVVGFQSFPCVSHVGIQFDMDCNGFPMISVSCLVLSVSSFRSPEPLRLPSSDLRSNFTHVIFWGEKS